MSGDEQHGLTSLVTLACAIVLALPSVLNGAPFLYFDSAVYIGQGGKAVAELLPSLLPGGSAANIEQTIDQADTLIIGGRSIYYGVLAYFSYLAGDVWPLIALQSLVLAWLIVMLFRHSLPGAWALPAVLTVMGLTVLTSTAFFVGLVLPDIWAGYLILAVALLVVHYERLSLLARGTLLAIIAFSVLSHASHLALLAAMTGLGLVGWIIFTRVRGAVPLASLGALSACVALGIAGQILFSFTVEKIYGAPPISRPFLTAHLVDLGPGSVYAKDVCPEAGYAICDYTDRLPINWISFLFSGSPHNGVFGSAPPDVKRALSAEQLKFAVSTVKADPVGALGGLAFDGVAQLWHLSIDDVPMVQSNDWFLSSYFPPELIAMTRTSWLYSRAEVMSVLTNLNYAGTAFSAVLIAVLLLRFRQRSTDLSLPDGIPAQLVAIITICLVGIVLNALICGILASPYGRFQARIVWIIPLLTTLTVTSLLYIPARPALIPGKTA